MITIRHPAGTKGTESTPLIFLTHTRNRTLIYTREHYYIHACVLGKAGKVYLLYPVDNFVTFFFQKNK